MDQHTAGDISEAPSNQNPTRQQDDDDGSEIANRHESAQTTPFNSRNDILKALNAVEKDSAAIAESYAALFASLRLSLSQATSSTVDHMNCFSDAAGHLQECVLDTSTKGNRYINSCLRLNEEMKGMDALATQLKVLRRHVDSLDSAVNRITRLP